MQDRPQIEGGMEKESEVVLLGTWPSGYCTRIELALKLKGIPYEYVEEDLSNKSHSLIHHNPVHKKVPVLLHNGKAIAESLVILEYIDEHWNHAPKLLPDDPYERAKVRFWANFCDQKFQPSAHNIMITKGEEQEKAIENFWEVLKVFEEECLERDFPTKSPFLNGDTLGYLDIVVGSLACNFEAFNEAVAEVLNLQKNPGFYSLVTAMKDCSLMKETLPPHDRLVAKIKSTFSLHPSN